MGQTRKIAFTYEVGVSRQTVDQISKLELQLDGVNKQIREAKKEGDEDTYQELRRSAQGLRDQIKDLNKDLRDQKRDFQDLSQAENSIENLRGQYRILKRELDKLDSTDPGFKKKAREAAELSDEIARLQKESGNFFSLVGRYEQEVSSALQASRGLFTGSITEIASAFSLGGALFQGIELLGEVGAAVLQLADQYREAARIISATTRAQGDDLEQLASSAIAVSRTFQLELNEIGQAQQQIQDNFQTGASETTRLLEQSLLFSADRAKTLGLINDEISKLASLGIPADSALALITEASNRNINVDILAEPIIRLREATPATVDALNAAFGPEGTQALFETFREQPLEAIQQVSQRLRELGPTSKEAGLLLADVFSSPGEDAIIAAQNIDQLARSLDDLRDPGDLYLIQQENLLAANKALADEQARLSQEFTISGTSLETLGQKLKAFGLREVNNFLRDTREIKGFFQDLFSGVTTPGGIPLPARRLGSTFQKEQEELQQLAAAEEAAAKRQVEARKAQGETLAELQNRIRGLRDQLANVAPGDNASIVRLKSELQKAESTAEALQKKLGLVKDETSGELTTGLALLNKELADLNVQLFEIDPGNLDEVSKTLTDIGEKEAEIRKAQIALRQLKEDIIQPLPGTGDQLAQALLAPVISGTQRLKDIQLQGQVAAVAAGQTPDQQGLEQAARIENQKQQEQDFLEFKMRMDEIDTEFKRQQQEKQLDDLEAFNEKRVQISTAALEQVGTATANFLTGQTKSFKEFAKELFLTALTAAENQILLSIGVGSAQAIASKGPILGSIEAAIIGGLIKGLFAAVKSQIKSFGYGGYIEHPFMIKGPSHSQGGVLINAEGGEGIINKRAMASDKVITTTGTPYQIASQLNQVEPGAGIPFPGTPKKVFKKGGPTLTVSGTPKQIISQVLQAGGVIEAEGGEGWVNRNAMASPHLVSVSGTPYQITRSLNQMLPGSGPSYSGLSVPSGIYQEGGVLGVPQIAVPDPVATTAEGEEGETVAFFEPSQIDFLARAIASQVGQSVKIALGEGIQDANRRIEREVLRDNQQNF